MALEPEDRAALLALASTLDDGPPGPDAVRFAQAHADALLDEIGAIPGASRVRAVALRLLPALLPPGDARDAVLGRAGEAVLTPPSGGGAAAIARHPAWIGLCALEIADLRPGWSDDPVERACELAGRAFVAAGGGRDLDEGEVLWAMAEQASDAGWHRRGDALLERALNASFADPAHRAQVRLLAAMRREALGRPPGPLLALVAEDDDALDRDRVHAAWILAHLRRDEGDAEGAIELLTLAATLVDRDEDAEVAARIDETRAAWAG